MSSRPSSPAPVSSVSTIASGASSRTNNEEELELSRKRKRTGEEKSSSSTPSLEGSAAAVAAATSADEVLCYEVTKKKEEEEKLNQMTTACNTILKCIGEDPNREGLLKTPERWAKALLFMTSGYKQTVESVINNAVFTEDSHKEIVVVKDIDIHSMCEHHMVPFTGRIHVGYIPNGKSEFLCVHASIRSFGHDRILWCIPLKHVNLMNFYPLLL